MEIRENEQWIQEEIFDISATKFNQGKLLECRPTKYKDGYIYR